MGKRRKKSKVIGSTYVNPLDNRLQAVHNFKYIWDTNLQDLIPSVKEANRECKRIVWGMVEWLCEQELRNREEQELQENKEQRASLFTDPNEAKLLDSLPLSFGKQKVPRSKKAIQSSTIGGKRPVESIKHLEYHNNAILQSGVNANMQEHNIVMAKWPDDGNFYPARVYGNGPKSQPAHPTSIISFLNFDNEPIEVSRCPSAMRSVSKKKRGLVEALLVDEERNRYDAPCPPTTLPKYWDQRYRLFSQFHRGVVLDEESWYSVTPEVIADHVSRALSRDCIEVPSHAQQPQRSCPSAPNQEKEHFHVIFDCFSGCGGNTISLAKHFPRSTVTAVDINAAKLDLIRTNSRVYDVTNNIELLAGDVYQILAGMSDGMIDLLLMSPPWGGPEYLKGTGSVQCGSVYDLKKLPSGDGVSLLRLAKMKAKNVIMLLPRNIDRMQLAEAVGELHGQPAGAIEDIYLHGKLKLTALYVGAACDVFE